jgi:hypothetical protein
VALKIPTLKGVVGFIDFILALVPAQLTQSIPGPRTESSRDEDAWQGRERNRLPLQALFLQ